MSLKKIENEALLELWILLEELENFEAGMDNVVSFSATLFQCSNTDFLPTKAISLAIKEWGDPNLIKEVEASKYKEISAEEMTLRIEQSISYIENKFGDWTPENPQDPHPIFKSPVERKLDHVKTANDYLERVEKCIDYRRSKIWEVELPSAMKGVFWYFDLVICNPNQGLCLYLNGGADD